MIAESLEPLDIECLVRTAVELWGNGFADLSERQKEVLGRASEVVDSEDGGTTDYPQVTALVVLAESNTFWVVRRSDSHTYGEVSFLVDEDSAYALLADYVRGCWDNIRFDGDG